MLFGVIVCTYSAMFISTPVLLYLDVRSGFSRSENTDEKVAAGAKS
jgi:preprotein translocase subunit SecF